MAITVVTEAQKQEVAKCVYHAIMSKTDNLGLPAGGWDKMSHILDIYDVMIDRAGGEDKVPTLQTLDNILQLILREGGSYIKFFIPPNSKKKVRHYNMSKLGWRWLKTIEGKEILVDKDGNPTTKNQYAIHVPDRAFEWCQEAIKPPTAEQAAMNVSPTTIYEERMAAYVAKQQQKTAEMLQQTTQPSNVPPTSQIDPNAIPAATEAIAGQAEGAASREADLPGLEEEFQRATEANLAPFSTKPIPSALVWEK